MYKATLVRARSENVTVAVKTIKKFKSEEETSEFLHEMGVMMNLTHPNIIHLYGIVQQGKIMLYAGLLAFIMAIVSRKSLHKVTACSLQNRHGLYCSIYQMAT